jgi:hypothetical protein
VIALKQHYVTRSGEFLTKTRSTYPSRPELRTDKSGGPFRNASCMRPSPPKRCSGYYLLLPLILFFACIEEDKAVELQPRDFAVELTCTLLPQRPRITLNWRGDQYARSYVIKRKLRNEGQWTQIGTAAGHETWFIDTQVEIGAAYEYMVIKEGTLGYTGYGYIYAGNNLLPVDQRGRIILLTEASVAEELDPELKRLESDLVGDGWVVVRRNVQRNAKPPEVKELIKSIYAEDPVNTRALFLFGNIPVPYSGDITPDEHDNHKGAWPADTYYADLDGTWTDSTVTSSGSERDWNINVPGDGKFDQSEIPSKVELQVGRVDLSRMTCFVNKSPPREEIDLLRQYLDKDHRWRHGQTPVEARGLIYDRIGLRDPEPLSTTSWRTLAPFVGENIDVVGWGEYMPAVSSKTYLWTAVSAGGGFTHSDGVGTADAFALNTVHAVFTSFVGSYYGDWDVESNFLRAALGAGGTVLSSVYGGKPQWLFHTMALGETLGQAVKLTQENGSDGIYVPHAPGTGQVHITLHGDPTLRAHPVLPPRNVRGVRLGDSILLSWDPTSAGEFKGYFVYQAETAGGPYVRVTPEPLPSTTFLAEHGLGKYFLVKTAAITQSPSGSYWNTSQGAFYPETSEAANGAPSAPRNLAVTKLRPDAITLTWLSTSVNETGFELERLAPGEPGFVKVATVPTDTLTYQDTALTVPGSYGYRVRAINASGASDYSNPVFPSTRVATVEFVGFDRDTRGAWTNLYGKDGYSIPGVAEKLPHDSSLTLSNSFFYRATPSPSDPRAVAVPASTYTSLNCWVNSLPFALQMGLNDESFHQVAIYTMDYNRFGAFYDIAIHDAVSGALLDQRRMENLNEGVYSIYNVRGQVYIEILPPDYRTNAEIYGVFFDIPTVHPVQIDPPGGTFAGKTLVRLESITQNADIRYTLDGSLPGPDSLKYTEPFWLYATAQLRARAFKGTLPPSDLSEAQFQNSLVNRVAFLRWDEQTKGSWTFGFGAEGSWVAGGAKALPAYAEVTLRPENSWLWADNSSDDRAPFRDGSAQQRVAAAWYAPETLEVDLGVFDTKRRAVALYFLDWDNQGRAEDVELLNETGVVVDRFRVEQFANGKYLVIGLKGYTHLRIRRVSGENAVLSGIFFDPAPSAVNAGTPVPLANLNISNGLMSFTATGFEDENFCVDASVDLKNWSCLLTNIFTTRTATIQIPLEPEARSRFLRAHIVP